MLLTFCLSFLSVVFYLFYLRCPFSYLFVRFSDKKRALRIDSFPRSPILALILEKIGIFFCIILIDRVLRRILVSFDCQTVFVLQNSHDAFLSETVSDPFIFGFLPCHLWFFTLSFQRFYSNKVPFYEPCGTKGDGKSRFCFGLRKEWLFCALYFVSKRGGCFVKNV